MRIVVGYIGTQKVYRDLGAASGRSRAAGPVPAGVVVIGVSAAEQARLRQAEWRRAHPRRKESAA